MIPFDLPIRTEGGSTLTSYALGGTELLKQTRGGVMSYYLHDGQGNTRALSDDSGAVTDTYAYTAFGELYVQTGTIINAYLYTGQQFDSLTGLYSLRARYYDSGNGRFLSRDAANLVFMTPGEIDRYVYVMNNPVNGIDPLGHQAFVEYSKANEQAAEEDSAVAEQGGSLAQDVYDNTIYDSIEDLSAVSSNDSAAFNSTRINLAKTSGHWGEQQFAQSHPESIFKLYRNTSQGNRVLDFYDMQNNIAYEVKTGYQSLSMRVSEKIAKDADLLYSGKVDEIIWEFYRSPINGKIGASQPLIDLLEENGFKIIIHY